VIIRPFRTAALEHETLSCYWWRIFLRSRFGRFDKEVRSRIILFCNDSEVELFAMNENLGRADEKGPNKIMKHSQLAKFRRHKLRNSIHHKDCSVTIIH